MDKKSFCVLVAAWLLLAPIFVFFSFDSLISFVIGSIYSLSLFTFSCSSTIMRKFWRKYVEIDKKMWSRLKVR